MANISRLGRFQKGGHYSPATEFKKGQTPWNKGVEYTEIAGDKHPNWRGGKPDCADCGKKLSSYKGVRCLKCYLALPTTKSRLKESGFQKGQEGPRRGVVLSDEQKKLISINRSGKYGGEKSSGWKGGITSKERLERVKFRQKMQPLVFLRDDYTCQNCEQRGGSLQVHHIKPWSKHPELRFDIDNCQTLCMGCHYYITFKRKLPLGSVWGHNLGRRVAS